MIDPTEPQDVQIARQARIIDALMRRARRMSEQETSSQGTFRSAIELQGQVWARTRDLERATSELETLRVDRARARRMLAQSVSAMEDGFALFVDRRLEICNELFRRLLPDLTEHIRPGLALTRYIDAVRTSASVVSRDGAPGADGFGTMVVELAGDRFFQISARRSGSGDALVSQTDISTILRQNRSERADLIDMQSHYVKAAFEHVDSGLCTFSRDGELILNNARFRALLDLPMSALQKGRRLEDVMRHVMERGLIANADELEFASWQAELRRGGHLRRRLRHVSGRVLRLDAHTLPDGGFILDLDDISLEARHASMLEQRVAARTAELTRANARLRAQSDAQTRVEEELRHARDRAEAAVSSKTRFLAAASHDLLQPISAARLLIGSLARKARGTDLSTTVDHLGQSFESIQHLLEALLDISRLDSVERALEPAPVALGPLLDRIARTYRPVADGRGVGLRVVGCDATVESDADYLQRSLQNLVVNAINYTGAGGRVLVGCRRAGPFVRLEVRDTGQGISAADQARIFDEFTRVGGSGQPPGMGLGLSIVQRTCRHLGHDLTLRSSPGQGSCFAISMARSDRPAPPAPSAAPGPEPKDETTDLIVLLVENDPSLLYVTTELLEGWGAGVLQARTVAEAVDVTRQIGTAPDIVLADYHLDDGATGIDAIRQVRAEAGRDVPAILHTGNRSDGLGPDLAALGVPLMAKPVDTALLRRRVAAMTAEAGSRTDKGLR